jgi:hypothetical protein
MSDVLVLQGPALDGNQTDSRYKQTLLSDILVDLLSVGIFGWGKMSIM